MVSSRSLVLELWHFIHVRGGAYLSLLVSGLHSALDWGYISHGFFAGKNVISPSPQVFQGNARVRVFSTPSGLSMFSNNFTSLPYHLGKGR